MIKQRLTVNNDGVANLVKKISQAIKVKKFRIAIVAGALACTFSLGYITTLTLAYQGDAKSYKEESLRYAAQTKDIKQIDKLVAQHIDVNARDEYGWTPLMHAVAYNPYNNRDQALASIKSLIEAGADVNAKNKSGMGVLRYAVSHRDREILRTILNAGADVNITNDVYSGETILMSVAGMGLTEAVEELLAAGANVNARNKTGQTALMWAAANGHADIVQLLIAEGADTTAVDQNGQTALMMAATPGHKNVVSLLNNTK